ncbi:MAG: AraC family transcriptional regulator ligand-binding domain-containing protein [Proteobacteria bacterium]|nr:AraC family transcriptional regulator ligand-binding domain-containing protein [Pseudomonadota bacterium]
MTEIGYSRMRDLGCLPDLLKSLAGKEGVNRVFRDQGLPIGLLGTPDVAVPMRDLVALYQRAAEITGVRSFGLQATKDFDPEQHGLAGRYIMQGRDLPGALERFRTALPYHESGSSLEIEAKGNELRIGYRNVYQDIVGWRHFGDYKLCVIANVISGYLGDGWRPLRIETCNAKGPWEQDHEDFFAAPVHCREDRTAIVLERETVRTNGQARVIEPRQMVSLGDLRRLGETLPRDLPAVVANIVERRLTSGAADLDGTAATLGLGSRTLQRRLGEHGLSYRDLVLRQRMRRAHELLAEPELTVRQVGREVGYSSTPQFTRAFKTHFKATPQEFRESTF